MSTADTADKLIVRGGLTVPVVLALIGAAALAGAFVTAATADQTEPSTEPVRPEPEPVNVQSYTSRVETSANVTNGTALYDEGQRLENMPVYFFQSTPNLTFHVRTNGTRADGPPPTANVTSRLSLVLVGSREGQVFFESQRPLAVSRGELDGGPHWANTTVNVTAIRDDVREKRSAIGLAGRLRVELVLNVTYDSEAYEGQLAASTPLVLNQQSYRLGETLNASDTQQSMPEETPTPIPQTPADQRSAGGLALTTTTLGLAGGGLVMLLIAGAIGYRYRRIDHRAIRAEIARERYDEWISRGEIPTKTEKEYIRTDSLEDLVDVAIDSGKRVIHDVDLDAYAVVEGDLVYYYSPTESDVTDWFDL